MSLPKESGVVQSHLKLPSQKEFLLLASHIKKLAGINLPLSDKNKTLLSVRLQKLERKGICSSYAEVIEAVQRGDISIIAAFVFAMTTNTTSFFRENDHYEILKGLLPQFKGPVRIWSSPCSTGEEPYSLAMTAEEILGDKTEYKILATDINEIVLRIARRGEYPINRLNDIKPSMSKYFTDFQDGDERRIKISSYLQSKVHFGQFNLLLDYPFDHPFDVIFCRNVLIYFEKKDVEYVVKKMRDNLKRGGYLFLGHSESAAGTVPGLKRVGPAVFMKE